MKYSITFELYGDIFYPGFKPLFWILASKAALAGWITDSGPRSRETKNGKEAEEESCVIVRLEGAEDAIKQFIQALPSKLYPAFTLKELRVVKRVLTEDSDNERRKPFKLLSAPDDFLYIRPDYAPCPRCTEEMLSPDSVRYCYPFWSCSACGPEYSSMFRSPFIRKNTYLASFPPCRHCRTDYEDKESSTHYHSEMLSCPSCGPSLFLLDGKGNLLDDQNSICSSRSALASGEILALQSMFGAFQLFVDPFNPNALQRLRERKHLPDRAIAVMARNLDVIRTYCLCSPAEEELLASPACPVVILQLRPDLPPSFPAECLSPDSPTLGVSLPPTSLMRLLFEHTAACTNSPCRPFDLLATCSSNWNGRKEEVDVDEMMESLRPVADKFLCHDLRIGVDCSASLATVRKDGSVQILRRSRGYTPLPVKVRIPLRRVAASFGSDVNASVALGFGEQVIPSQHIGDVTARPGALRLSRTLERFTMLYDTVPDVVACDMNSKFYSSDAAAAFAEKYAIPLIIVQTHHAHALSCMAESGLEEAVALVFGHGTPGPDGYDWGAELLDTKIDTFRRLGTFSALKIPIVPAVQEKRFANAAFPSRPLLRGALHLALRMKQASVLLTDERLRAYGLSDEEIEQYFRSPAAPSGIIKSHAAAALFDAFAAALGIAPAVSSYRVQNLTRLAAAATRFSSGLPQELPESIREIFQYSCKEEDSMLSIDWSPLFRNLAALPLPPPSEVPIYAYAFHDALARAAAEMAGYAGKKTTERNIVISGTVFADSLLADLTAHYLKEAGWTVHQHHDVPMDESGLCVGQAYHAGISD